MVYIVEYEWSDENGGGYFGPYIFEDYNKSLKFFMDAVTDNHEEIKWKKSRSCYAADLYRVDYREGTTSVIMKYDRTELGISSGKK